MAQKASSVDKVKILSLKTKVVELKGKLEDLKLNLVFHDSNVVRGVIEEPAQINSFEPKEIDSLRLELEQVKEDFNSKKHEIECMEKGIEATHEITSRERDALSLTRLNLIEENSRLRELVSKKDNEVDPPSPPMNDSSQKLPGWLSDDLRSLVYKYGLEDKVMEFDKSFAREHILEALQELLPRDEMVLRNQAVTYLINPFIVDQYIPKNLFQGKDYEAIRWRRSGIISPSNTSSTGHSYCCELLNVAYVNIFHTYLITYCNYMVRSQEKNMEFMERQAERKK